MKIDNYFTRNYDIKDQEYYKTQFFKTLNPIK
jgi:hypothetical protein